jgi:hypothetical protein
MPLPSPVIGSERIGGTLESEAALAPCLFTSTSNDRDTVVARFRGATMQSATKQQAS